jgi:hypothetical protein
MADTHVTTVYICGIAAVLAYATSSCEGNGRHVIKQSFLSRNQVRAKTSCLYKGAVKQAALRTLLILSYTPMALVTPPAYFFLFLNVFSVLDSASRNHLVSLGMSVISLFALFSLWRLWSIAKRLWIHAAYVPPSDGGRVKDELGLLAGWIAFAGIFALSFVDDLRGFGFVFTLSFLALPAALVSTVAFYWAQRRSPKNALQAMREEARA